MTKYKCLRKSENQKCQNVEFFSVFCLLSFLRHLNFVDYRFSPLWFILTHSSPGVDSALQRWGHSERPCSVESDVS